jgi:FAD/FMN-containing dehydrogenase
VTGTPTNQAPIQIPQLRTEFGDRVIAPDDPGYDRARTVVMGGFDRRPAVIIRPADAGDVARVVTLARDTGLPLSIRNGGHSGAGHSVNDGGIVLDLAALRGLEIDPEGRTAWAQAGLTAGDYTTAAGKHGLATGFGDTGTVGIAGITLGGGVGFLSRKYGLTIDQLLAAELVTADGELLRVDAESHPDLFWAIRGGGGNFGVATRFQYRLHEVGTVTGGMLMLPATPEVITGFVAAAQAAPVELTTIANVMTAPPMPFVPAEHHGTMVVFALLCHAGDPDAGQRELAPFRALATPLVDMVQPMPYPQLFAGGPESEDYHPTAVARTRFLDSFDGDVAATIVRYIESSDAPMRAAQLRVLGGAISQVPDDATAYAHRTRPIMANVAAFYQAPEEKPVRQAWVDEFNAALGKGDTEGYVNFLGDEPAERVRAAYPGATWDRLRAVKGRYDPTNLFRLNQNIPPLG